LKFKLNGEHAVAASVVGDFHAASFPVSDRAFRRRDRILTFRIAARSTLNRLPSSFVVSPRPSPSRIDLISARVSFDRRRVLTTISRG